MYRIVHKLLPYISLAFVVCLLVFMHASIFAQQPGNRGGNQGGGANTPGRGGGPGAATNTPGRGGMPGGGPGAAANTPGRGGMPGGGPGGGGFAGAANMQARGGMPGGAPFGGGGPFGGNIPGGGFPGALMQQPQAPQPQPRQQSTSANATMLLVPEFGEKPTESPRVARFGEYAETLSNASTARTVSANADSALQRQINDQAQQLMNRFDRDRNGMIERATGEWNNIGFDANAADTNRDGRITLDELRVYVGNQLRGKSGAKVFTSYATTYEHMPDGIPAWFTDRDKNNDGQLTLFEYANGQPITVAMIAEFEWLDMNNDGIATLAECYVAIKTKEDEERKKLEAEGGVPGGNSPRGVNPPTRNSTPAGGRGGNNTAGASFTPSADQAAGGRNVATRPTPNTTIQRGNTQPGGNNNQQRGGQGGPGGQQGGGRPQQRNGG